jgi:hypothetical protein
MDCDKQAVMAVYFLPKRHALEARPSQPVHDSARHRLAAQRGLQPTHLQRHALFIPRNNKLFKEIKLKKITSSLQLIEARRRPHAVRHPRHGFESFGYCAGIFTLRTKDLRTDLCDRLGVCLV